MSQKEPKDTKKSVRIPSKVMKFINDLIEHQIYGTNESEVLRHILLEGINQITKEELVRKTLESRRLAAQIEPDEQE